MATQLDLQEQEQLDALKAFWNTYGNLVTWTLVLVLGAFAAWNGWNWWQREQAAKAGALFEELDKAALASDAEKTGRVLADLKERYPRTAFAQHGALLAAKVQSDKGQGDAAQASLTWAAEHGAEPALRTIARLRLAALQAEAKQYDAALKSLETVKDEGFDALAADRRGDILLAQGKADQARAAYQVAYAGMTEKIDYRRVVEAKLTALAAPPGLAASAAVAGAVAAGASRVSLGFTVAGRVALLLAALAAACTADRPKPTPLETYAPKMTAAEAWTVRIGSINFPLAPAVRDGMFFVAAGDGDVLALRADTGAVVWRASAGARISAGVGSDGRYTSVVTRGNDVVTFDAGREVWRKRVTSAVVTPPLVAGERVFVMGVDRAVHAFDAMDGRRLWTLQRPGDALTLAQGSVIAPLRNTLLVGQGQRLTAVDPLRGSVTWEVPMASPRGSNEVERLADLIGPAVRVGDRVCARAFQAAVGCVDAARGALLWSRNVGGVQAVASDAEHVIGADASDRITAWRASSGDVAWTNERLLHRGLSGAVSVGANVVFGDGQGFVHFMAAATGEQQLRLATDGKAVVGTPVLAGDTLLVTTASGGLYAFRPR